MGYIRWIGSAVAAVSLFAVVGLLSGSGDAATGAVAPAGNTGAISTWTGEVSLTYTRVINGNYLVGGDPYTFDWTEDLEATITDLIFAINPDESTPDETVYDVQSGTIFYTGTGHHFATDNLAGITTTLEEDCDYEGEGEVELQPGDVSLHIKDDGGALEYNGTGGKTLPGERTGQCFLIGSAVLFGHNNPVPFPVMNLAPAPYGGGNELTGSADFGDLLTGLFHQEWNLFGEGGIVVNSTDDKPDDDLTDDVCSTGDSIEVGGDLFLECTLRAAIQTANVAVDGKRITFDIEGESPVISPAEGLPSLLGGVEIDGTTQPVEARVRIDGADAGGNGLALSGQGNLLKGLVLTRWLDGISILDGGTNVIQGNLIGTNTEGVTNIGNRDGIRILNSSNNLVGGTAPGQENVIGGNFDSGIVIIGAAANDNRIAENYIGILPGFEETPMPNGIGVNILAGEGNHVGLEGEGGGNVIAFNNEHGVQISAPASNNFVRGNYIGVTLDRSIAGNEGNGVFIDGSKDNTIGGDEDFLYSNFIGGNDLSGIYITGADAVGNKIIHNVVGANSSQSTPNKKDGIVIDGAPGTIIGGSPTQRNYISGNERYGILLSSPNTHGTQVLGNYLGLDEIETVHANGDDNIRIDDSWQNTIGTEDEPNVIVASKGDGVEVHGPGSYGNVIAGNAIGTGGDTAIPNEGNGITISNASRNIIRDYNTISGNGAHGVNIMGPDAEKNEVIDNYIGVAIVSGPGMIAMGNGEDGVLVFEASNNTIGQAVQGTPGNVISGNDGNGITIAAGSNKALSNDIVGNVIGANSEQDEAIPNGGDGIVVAVGAEWTNIGGLDGNSPAGGCLSPCNLISGNTGNGIEILGYGTGVRGNVIGLKGTVDCLDVLQPIGEFVGCNLGNGADGVRVFTGVNTRIGSAGFASAWSCNDGCNLIAFNQAGVSVEGVARLANIVGNAIFRNGSGLAIDLGGNGITPNDGEEDDWDPDTGPNDLRNSPTLLGAYDRGTEVVVVALVQSVANSVSTVDFYANQGCEGAQVYLGSGLSDTGPDGVAIVSRELALPAGDLWSHIVAIDGGGGNTSEVSDCRALAASGSIAASATSAGQSEVQVPAIDIYKFLVGDQVEFGMAAGLEMRTVIEIGGNGGGPQSAFSGAGTNVVLTLDAPLDNAHSAGEPVVPIAGGAGDDVTWGDINCDGSWNLQDAVVLLNVQVGISVQIGTGCPAIGGETIQAGQPVLWGDVDGSGDDDIDDVLAMLRLEAELEDATPRWLPGLGAPARLFWQ